MTGAPENTDPDRPDRDAAGRFGPGNPGRPRGSRNAAIVALDAIGHAGAEVALQAVVAAAGAGDLRAAEILLARVWPVRKGRPVTMDLPPMKSAADLPAALAAVAAGVAGGDLSPEEGQALAAILETNRRAFETAELEKRIAALEERQP